MTAPLMINNDDLRATAYHEAGHAIACARFGGVGESEAWANTSSDIAAGAPAFNGHFKMYAAPGSIALPVNVLSDDFYIKPLPANWRTVYGLAGMVCERLAFDLTTLAWEIEGVIWQQIDAGVASATDLEAMGAAWDESHVEEARQLLLDAWPAVVREAEAIMGKLS